MNIFKSNVSIMRALELHLRWQTKILRKVCACLNYSFFHPEASLDSQEGSQRLQKGLLPDSNFFIPESLTSTRRRNTAKPTLKTDLLLYLGSLSETFSRSNINKGIKHVFEKSVKALLYNSRIYLLHTFSVLFKDTSSWRVSSVLMSTSGTCIYKLVTNDVFWSPYYIFACCIVKMETDSQ